MPKNALRQHQSDIASRPMESPIHVVRDSKVMLDADLAGLYGVSTGALNQAVQRNLGRFPGDFMFQLTADEAKILISQFVISSWGGRRKLPHVFTQEGVAMLSSVLRSERAVKMNVLIMRAFVRLRAIVDANKDIAARVDKLERGHERAGSIIEVLAEDIDRLAREIEHMKIPPPITKRRIGYIINDD